MVRPKRFPRCAAALGGAMLLAIPHFTAHAESAESAEGANPAADPAITASQSTIDDAQSAAEAEARDAASELPSVAAI